MPSKSDAVKKIVFPSGDQRGWDQERDLSSGSVSTLSDFNCAGLRRGKTTRTNAMATRISTTPGVNINIGKNGDRGPSAAERP
jgi:hypothetical protein